MYGSAFEGNRFRTPTPRTCGLPRTPRIVNHIHPGTGTETPASMRGMFAYSRPLKDPRRLWAARREGVVEHEQVEEVELPVVIQISPPVTPVERVQERPEVVDRQPTVPVEVGDAVVVEVRVIDQPVAVDVVQAEVGPEVDDPDLPVVHERPLGVRSEERRVGKEC